MTLLKESLLLGGTPLQLLVVVFDRGAASRRVALRRPWFSGGSDLKGVTRAKACGAESKSFWVF